MRTGSVYAAQKRSREVFFSQSLTSPSQNILGPSAVGPRRITDERRANENRLNENLGTEMRLSRAGLTQFDRPPPF